MSRDSLRQSAFKSAPRRRESFEYNGSTFEILSPTVGEYSKLAKHGDDTVIMSIKALIILVVEPGTDTRVFEDTDMDAFLGQGLDGFMRASQDALLKVLEGASSDEKKDMPASN